jgi:wobble nucleotide-excising tRNase
MAPKLAPIEEYDNLESLARRLRALLEEKKFALLYAYNGTGKTRLSMAFKDVGKTESGGDTLYYNAYTEDLFSWDNDLEGDTERKLKINANSRFIQGARESAVNIEERIGKYLERYASFNFRIDYENWFVDFYYDGAGEDFIKVSRGEENLFIWCVFLAICEMAIEGEEAYSWVKYIYIDDPISSLDDNNAIAVASDLAKLLRDERNGKKVVISSHHGLFFNVMCNELKGAHSFFLCNDSSSGKYRMQKIGDTPFFNHVAMVAELKEASESGHIYTYHFNILRNVLERTASFFGYKDFSRCIVGIEDEALFARALNLLSHGNYSIFEPHEMVADNKELFNRILNGFLSRYEFNLPEIFASESNEVNPND